MTTKKKQLMEELTSTCTKFAKLKNRKKNIDNEISILRDEILDYSSRLKVDKLDISSYTKEENNTITIIKSKKFSFDIDLLREKLDSELANEIIETQVIIIAVEKFLSTLRRLINKLPAKMRKKAAKAISSTYTKNESVSMKKLDQLLDVGDITLDDIEGCYEIVESKSVRMN